MHTRGGLMAGEHNLNRSGQRLCPPKFDIHVEDEFKTTLRIANLHVPEASRTNDQHINGKIKLTAVLELTL